MWFTRVRQPEHRLYRLRGIRTGEAEVVVDGVAVGVVVNRDGYWSAEHYIDREGRPGEVNVVGDGYFTRRDAAFVLTQRIRRRAS